MLIQTMSKQLGVDGQRFYSGSIKGRYVVCEIIDTPQGVQANLVWTTSQEGHSWNIAPLVNAIDDETALEAAAKYVKPSTDGRSFSLRKLRRDL